MWSSSVPTLPAGVLLWSSQQQECRLVSQGQWVENLSVCLLFAPLLTPQKTVQGLDVGLKQQGSVKLDQ